MFYYDGLERFQLFLDSPNKLAVLINMLLFLILGLSEYLSRKKINPLFLLVFWITVVVLQYMLCITYSRGGMVAFLFASVAFILLQKSRISIYNILSFLLVLISAPSGVKRLSDLDLTFDLSIANRILLWVNTCDIIKSNFWSGIDTTVGRYFVSWYQPLSRNELYTTAVNDYLTIGAVFGGLVLGAYIYVNLTLIYLYWLYVKRNAAVKNCIISGLVCSIISYLVASCFSTFYNDFRLFAFFVALVAILLIKVCVNLRYYKLKNCLITHILTLAIIFAICLVGMYNEYSNKTTLFFKSYDLDDERIKIVFLKNSVNKNTAIYLFDRNSITLEMEARESLRKLQPNFGLVIGIGVTTGDRIDSIAEAIDYSCGFSNPNGNVVLIGQNIGGQVSVIVAGKIKQPLNLIVAIGSYASWPFSEYSPIRYIRDLKSPLFIIHGEKDGETPVREAMALYEECRKHGVECSISIVPGASNYLYPHRGKSLEMINVLLNE